MKHNHDELLQASREKRFLQRWNLELARHAAAWQSDAVELSVTEPHDKSAHEGCMGKRREGREGGEDVANGHRGTGGCPAPSFSSRGLKAEGLSRNTALEAQKFLTDTWWNARRAAWEITMTEGGKAFTRGLSNDNHGRALHIG